MPDAEKPRAAAVRETDEGGGGVGPLEEKLRQPAQRRSPSEPSSSFEMS